MSIPKQARLVESRTERRWMLDRLADDDEPAGAKQISALIFRLMAADARRCEGADPFVHRGQ
ncbi:MAG: hypothetical protein ACLQNE_21170 [Thermoguttaceae bacterium]|jgi:hypothetical protein